MISQVVSLNLGQPETLSWNGQTVQSSMRRRPVAGPIQVNVQSVVGNVFASPQIHGDPDSVLYIYGLSSARSFMRELGRSEYPPGLTGETVTVEDLDERLVFIGDIFRIGSVLAQATAPRIPCGKVSLLMESADGQSAMQRCGRSGVYFKVLEPGSISISDRIEKTHGVQTSESLSIADVYARSLNPELIQDADLERREVLAHLPARGLEKWRRVLAQRN